MSTAAIIGNLILVGGVTALSIGSYFQTKQVYFQDLFKNVEKCQKFHLDYVESTQHLPIDKQLLLFGTARAKNPIEDKVITRTYIKQTVEEDRLWSFKFHDKFGLATAGSEIVEVEPSPDEEKVIAFNLHRKQQDGKHEERVIHHNQPVCVFGKIVKSGQNGRKIYPQMLMGSKQEQVLGFLDQQIIKLNQKGRIAILTGTILLFSHVVGQYFQLWGFKSRKT